MSCFYFVLLATSAICKELAHKGDTDWVQKWTQFLENAKSLKEAPVILRSMCGVVEQAAVDRVLPSQSGSGTKKEQAASLGLQQIATAPRKAKPELEVKNDQKDRGRGYFTFGQT